MPEATPSSSLSRCRSPLLALVLVWAGAAQAACVDEDKFDTRTGQVADGAKTAAPLAPRSQLQGMVQDALARNQGVVASRLLAEAAMTDIEEAKAAKLPQASMQAGLTPAYNKISGGVVDTSGLQLEGRASVSISQAIFDGGRGDRMIDWRRQQAEAARLGLLSTQEQITLATTSLAFERSRFRMQATIYGQQVRKMSCLVEALDTIVAADKGRLSELVQARKQLQMSELQQSQAVSQARQVEAKMRRVVGDGLPATEGMSSLLLSVPDINEVLASAERAVEITQLDANAAAALEMARVVEAATKPQVSWNVGGSGSAVAGGASQRSANLSAGISLSVPLYNKSIDYSVQAARKRAEAARAQRADALESRRQRIVEVHEQATNAFERVGRVVLVLRDSDRLRNFTLQQWQQLGRRSLFDVMAAESDHYGLRVQYVNALFDGEQMNATLLSLGAGLVNWLR